MWHNDIFIIKSCHFQMSYIFRLFQPQTNMIYQFKYFRPNDNQSLSTCTYAIHRFEVWIAHGVPFRSTQTVEKTDLSI